MGFIDTGGNYYEGEMRLGDRVASPVEQANHDAMVAAKIAQEQVNAADIAAAKSYAKLQALRTMTPAQIQAWVAANVTNLAQAQDVITTLAIAVGILARRL